MAMILNENRLDYHKNGQLQQKQGH